MTTTVEATSLSKPQDEIPPYLNVTAPLPGYSAVVGSTVIQVRPLNSLEDGGPVILRIPPDPTRMLQTCFLRISGKSKINMEGGGDIPKGIPITFVDNFGAAWIKSANLIVGGQVHSLSVGTNLYTKTQVMNLVNYSADARRGHLQAGGSRELMVNEMELAVTGQDGAAKLEGTPPPDFPETEDSIKNWSFLKQSQSDFAESRLVSWSVDLAVDVFRTTRDWIAGVDVTLELHRNPASFVLLREDLKFTNENTNVGVPEIDEVAKRITGKTREFMTKYYNDHPYQYSLEDIVLHVRKVQPSSAVLSSIETKLLSSPALYPFQSWTANQTILPAGRKSYSSPTFWSGSVPGKSLYCLMPLKAETGDYSFNPGMFKHYGLAEFEQLINGIPSPIPKLTWTWKKDADDKDHKDDYAVSYRSFLDQVGFTGRNLGCGVTWKDYRTHRFLIAYSNSAVGLSASTDPYRERNMRGDVSCNLKFQDELTQDLVLIAFAITDDVYAIDKDRKMVINPPMY